MLQPKPLKNKNKLYKSETYKTKRESVSTLSLFLCTLILSACGGGGGSSSTPPVTPPPVNQSPNAVISVNGSQGSDPFTVEFSAANSSDTDGQISSYAWDFTNDGTVDANDSSVSFTYTELGMFTATLTVTDNDGATDSTNIEISVNRAIETLAFLGDDGNNDNGETELYLVKDDGSELTPIVVSGSNTRINNFVFSPDGEAIAYTVRTSLNGVTQKQDLMLIELETGNILTLNQDIGNEEQIVFDYQWSPDSSQIVYSINSGPSTRLESEVWLVNRDGSERSKISGSLGTPPRVEVHFPKWSSDGQYIFQHVRNLISGDIVAINTYDTTLGTANSTRLFTTDTSTNQNIVRLMQTANTTPRVCYGLNTTAEMRVSDASMDSNSLVYTSDAGSNCQWSTDDTRILNVTADPTTGTQALSGYDPDNLNPSIIFAQGSRDTIIQNREVWRPGFNDEISYMTRLGFNPVPGPVQPRDDKLFYVDGNGMSHDVGSATNVADSYVRMYLWSTDGERIAYQRFYSLTDARRLYVTNPTGSVTFEVTEGLEDTEVAAWFSWSQDSRRLAYATVDTSTAPRGLNMYFVNSNGTEPTKLELTDMIDISGLLVYQPRPVD